MTHLYPAAAKSLKEDNANLAHEFNNNETRVQSRTNKKRIVNGQPTQLTEQRSRRSNDKAAKLKCKEAMIESLKTTLLEFRGMDPNFSEPDFLDR